MAKDSALAVQTAVSANDSLKGHGGSWREETLPAGHVEREQDP